MKSALTLGIICMYVGMISVKLEKFLDVVNREDVAGQFTHGVASGDPDHQSVVLWTRFVREDSASAMLKWELSSDSSFEHIPASGRIEAQLDHDFCVKTIANNLQAGTTYYYRFRYQDKISPTGITQTLPEQTDRVKIGVANCAKYTGGYYHAYEALAQHEDLDVVIHLGDYIYEGGAAKPGDSYWPAYLATGRQHDPPYECLSLKDYRTRYAQYRSDTALQKLHARYPMIAIWDDHEIPMKPLKKLPDGSLQYGGDWEGRKQNALKAYYEWIPIRTTSSEPIYRSFQLGKLVNLMMLDVRVCCKSEVPKTLESLKDTSRHIVGNKQLQWIFQEVEAHNATWNIFGNQLLISTKGMGWERWQGFPADRNRFLDFVAANPQRNFLFTTGNAHNPHHYIVMNEAGTDTLLHEVLPGSISSGNNAEKAKYDPRILEKEATRLRNAENVLWFHQDSHGYIILDLEEHRAQVDWYFVKSIREKTYQTVHAHTAVISAH